MTGSLALNTTPHSVLRVKKKQERNFVILVGGPGLYDGSDPQHDKAWHNYIHPIMVAAKDSRLALPDEHTRWYIYEPAYQKRWGDDATEPTLIERHIRDGRLQVTRHDHTKKVTAYGALNYVDYIEKKAVDYVQLTSRKITVHKIKSDRDFWDELGSFSDQSISRVWFLGHAAGDLWLSLEHNARHQAVSPANHEVVKRADILKNKALVTKFAPDHQPSRFYGCNTEDFARIWSETLNVTAEGANGKVNFNRSSLRDIERSAQFGWKKFTP
jgi:hypothetical protein